MKRLRWCLEHIDHATLAFVDMYDYVHVDEKWFYLQDGQLNPILAEDEESPMDSGKGRRYSPKIMFLCAVARPWFDENDDVIFDGKLGCWPFVEERRAKRTSRLRPAGTVEKHPINVDREVYRTFIVEKVLLAIRKKWPVRRTGKIFVQQDNAPAHVSSDDYRVVGNGKRYGWDISMRAQPPNSPDFNVSDLGFFRALQSASQEHGMNNISDVVKYVTKSFHEMNQWSLNDVFLSLFKHMEASMEVNGGKFYKESHLSKVKRRKAVVEQVGIVYCDSDVYDNAVALVETGLDE